LEPSKALQRAVAMTMVIVAECIKTGVDNHGHVSLRQDTDLPLNPVSTSHLLEISQYPSAWFKCATTISFDWMA
jgi:hypothetical protein